LDILKARPEDVLDITAEDTKLIIRGKGNRITRLAMETEVLLPVKEVKKPKKWYDLPKNFLEAVDMVHRCCGSNQERLETFGHFTGERIEAIGEHQVGHYRIKLPLDCSVLVHKDSVKHVVPLGMTEFGLSKRWLHFRNSGDVVLSCLRWPQEDDYPDTDKITKAKKGKQINLPRGLDKAVSRAAIFSRDNPEDTDIEINLKMGKVICKGTGIQGDHKESRKIKYTGGDMKFTISPVLLNDLCHKHTEAWLTPAKLTVKSGKFTFVTALGIDDDNEDNSEE